MLTVGLQKFKMIQPNATKIILLLTVIILAHSEFVGDLSGNSDQIIAYRRYIKENNLNRIRDFNSQRNGQTLYPYPEFIHYTTEELSQIYANKQMGSLSIGGVEFQVETRRQGYQNIAYTLRDNPSRFVNNTLFTGIPKNQGKCGSCFSFAGNSVVNYATNAIYMPADPSMPNNFKQASQQEVIECSTANSGCGGGWPHLVLLYIKSNGILTDRSYRYRAQTYYNKTVRPCEITKNTVKELAIQKSIVRVSQYNSVTNLINIIDSHKVAAIAVVSTGFNFIYYKSGILTNCGSGQQIDHAVTLVGYLINHETQEYAWYIKNSWGTSWGMNGHILVSMLNNTCSSLNYASYLATY